MASTSKISERKGEGSSRKQATYPRQEYSDVASNEKLKGKRRGKKKNEAGSEDSQMGCLP